MKGVALVDGKTAAEAEMNAVAVDRDPETSPAEPRAVSERT
jgi:hypothetical protein